MRKNAATTQNLSISIWFLPSCLFPEFEIVLFHNSTQFTEFPSPAQRVACRWNDECRSTNLKKFSKIEQVAAPGPRASRHSACSFSKRDGQNSRQRPTQRLYPHPNPHPNLYFLKGVDATALKGGREGKIRKTNTCMFKFRQNYAKIY